MNKLFLKKREFFEREVANLSIKVGILFGLDPQKVQGRKSRIISLDFMGLLSYDLVPFS